MKKGFIKDNTASIILTAFVLIAAVWSSIKGDNSIGIKFGVFGILLVLIVIWNYFRHNTELSEANNWFNSIGLDGKILAKRLFEQEQKRMQQ